MVVSNTSIYLRVLVAWMPISGTKFVENPYILVVKISMEILLTNYFPNKMSDTEMSRAVLIENCNSSSLGILVIRR